ncbi:hypothetical protein [Mucilaginibacter sp. KACC 22063]|uniref:hypothetical protein n=1 Tax=Mucilaginibacter sp. KACC 22063 TaxID=3025666 RepID=UPI0023662C18|nr:hypothetical protein [Mucilaginibacter sp. KACC 22063]WDF54898.1 hypothetical protein PQ461_18370 [Mucilaginibacter sp. KACC 22063]
MSYLYTMPECTIYAEQIRYKALDNYLRDEFNAWHKMYKDIYFNYDTGRNDLVRELPRFIWNEFIQNEFDLIYDLFMSKVSVYNIKCYMEKTFRSQKIRKNDVLINYASNPDQVDNYAGFWMWIDCAISRFKSTGFVINIPAKSHIQSIEKFGEIKKASIFPED